MIFKPLEDRPHCYIVELKDGHTFDTKKSAAEHASIQNFIAKNAPSLPYVVTGHFCAFKSG